MYLVLTKVITARVNSTATYRSSPPEHFPVDSLSLAITATVNDNNSPGLPPQELEPIVDDSITRPSLISLLSPYDIWLSMLLSDHTCSPLALNIDRFFTNQTPNRSV